VNDFVLSPDTYQHRHQGMYEVNRGMLSPLNFIGTLDHCRRQAERLKDCGVDEIASLNDFGIGPEDVMAGFRRLSMLLVN